jgi:circadian clock protein KaiC
VEKGTMREYQQPTNLPRLERVPTGIAGLDAILGGGLPSRRTCLIAGAPGSGKTTLGNQLAFAHAASGGSVVVATLLTESHDILLENLAGFRFFERGLVGDRVHYLSLLTPLLNGGLDAVTDVLRNEVRQRRATLLVIDGTAVVGDFASTALDMRHFAQRLEAQFAFLGCTTLLLTSYVDEDLRLLGGHVNGVIYLSNHLVGARHVRSLEIYKQRGINHAGGTHELAISEAGVTLYPRLESLAGKTRPPQRTSHGLGTGVSHLDTMLGGGLMPLSTTVVMGTPGAGKTLLGLTFLVEGARKGEQGLYVGFHETVDDLCTTAEGIGLNLRRFVEDDTVRVLWEPPLELCPDGWAWRVLTAVDDHAPERVFIDALTDVHRVMPIPQRIPMFVAALVNELRARGTTVLLSAEIDAYTDEHLTVPIPAASASMDNGILLRHVEINGRLQRLVSVLKVRQAASDPEIRGIEISDHGITISRSFSATSGLLTGRASPYSDNEGEAT